MRPMPTDTSTPGIESGPLLELPHDILETIVDAVAENLLFHRRRPHIRDSYDHKREALKTLLALSASSRLLHWRAQKHIFHTIHFWPHDGLLRRVAVRTEGSKPKIVETTRIHQFLGLVQGEMALRVALDTSRDPDNNNVDDPYTLRSCVRALCITIDKDGEMIYPDKGLVDVISILSGNLEALKIEGKKIQTRVPNRVREVDIRALRTSTITAENRLGALNWQRGVHPAFQNAVWGLVFGLGAMEVQGRGRRVWSGAAGARVQTQAASGLGHLGLQLGRLTLETPGTRSVVEDDALKTLSVGGFTSLPLELVLQAGTSVQQVALRGISLHLDHPPYSASCVLPPSPPLLSPHGTPSPNPSPSSKALFHMGLLPRPITCCLEGDYLSSFLGVLDALDTIPNAEVDVIAEEMKPDAALNAGIRESKNITAFSTFFGCIKDLTLCGSIDYEEIDLHDRWSVHNQMGIAVRRIVQACYNTLEAFQWHEELGAQSEGDTALPDNNTAQALIYAPKINSIVLHLTVSPHLRTDRLPSLAKIFDWLFSPGLTEGRSSKSTLKYIRIDLTIPVDFGTETFWTLERHCWGKLVDDLAFSGRFNLAAIGLRFRLECGSRVCTQFRGEVESFKEQWAMKYREWGQELVRPLVRAGLKCKLDVV